MGRSRTILMLASLALLAAAQATASPTLAERLLSATDGSLIMSFESDDDVYGRGDDIRCGEAESFYERGWERGPCRLLLEFRDGRLRDTELRVGSKNPRARGEVTDLGDVDPVEAAAALLDLAARGKGSALDQLFVPARFARGAVIWPRLLELARDRSRPDELRESALFWLGQEAGEAATAGLVEILDDEDDELEIRERAIFALSQRPMEECFPVLSRVATDSPHPQLREQALFWLAQHDDPRVFSLFENILIGN